MLGSLFALLSVSVTAYGSIFAAEAYVYSAYFEGEVPGSKVVGGSGEIAGATSFTAALRVNKIESDMFY